MKPRFLLTLVGMLIGAVVAGSFVSAQSAPAANRGTIKGHIRLMGKLPGNPVIRMSVDPMCSRMNAGKRVIQETVVASIDGSLANVVVKLQGSLPQTPVPAEAVTIDQRGCVYIPRIVGVRVGQTLQIRNSDMLLHNVHSLSAGGNSFNVGQPVAGMVQKVQMKTEEVFRLKCDLHNWMTAYVAVVTNPYFGISDTAGLFQIKDVPAGTYAIQAWHERYGALTQMVRVRPGAAATVDFSYTGTEKPPTAQNLPVDEGLFAAR